MSVLPFPSPPVAVGAVHANWTWNGQEWVRTPIHALMLTGGTMAGAIDMATHAITDLPQPTGDEDAATKLYVDDLITGVKNLGLFAGGFPTHAALPANASALPGLTPNDFVTVAADETHGGASTRYIATAIAADGTITWAYDFTYSTDISGKQNLVTTAAVNSVATFDASGQVQAAGNAVMTGDLSLTGVNSKLTVYRELVVGPGFGAQGGSDPAFHVGPMGEVIISCGTYFAIAGSPSINGSPSITGDLGVSGNLTMTGDWSKTFTCPGQFKLGPNYSYIDYPTWWPGVPGYFPYIFINSYSDLVLGSGSQLLLAQYAGFNRGFYVNEDAGATVQLMGTNIYISGAGPGTHGQSVTYWSSSAPSYTATLSLTGGANALIVGAGVNAIQINNGAAVKPGGGSWSAPSDIRTKTDVQAYERGLADLAKLNPIRFRYNGRARIPETGKTYVGLHAEEVRDVMPEMVRAVRGQLDYDDEETDILHVDPSDLQYAILNALKELTKRIEALEAR